MLPKGRSFGRIQDNKTNIVSAFILWDETPNMNLKFIICRAHFLLPESGSYFFSMLN